MALSLKRLYPKIILLLAALLVAGCQSFELPVTSTPAAKVTANTPALPAVTKAVAPTIPATIPPKPPAITATTQVKTPAPVITTTALVVTTTASVAKATTPVTTTAPVSPTARPGLPPAPSPTPPAPTGPVATQTANLTATITASLPPVTGTTGVKAVNAIALRVPAGQPPLWAVFTTGLRSFQPPQQHFVAIYTNNNGKWQELSRLNLQDADYIDPMSVRQVQIDPSRIWLQVDSGAGAHSGCFNVLSYDFKAMHDEISACNSSPGAGDVKDVNGDGKGDVILNGTDYYVFCYACGLRYFQYSVLQWDGARFAEVQLAPLSPYAPENLARLTNQAVEQAQAGLWKDAQATISQTLSLKETHPDATWDAALIGLHAAAFQQQAQHHPYQLLARLFYGDYPGTLDVMRPYSPEILWGQQTPLVTGTMAEGWAPQLTYWISSTTNMAIKVKPDLAAAYFLRGWALNLQKPGNPEAVADVERAAKLAPQEKLFADSLAYLRKRGQ
ncbi:MAG: hypothetical protein HY326_13555 [Chloroflexi bacterium]|nr:hypothetical protein [Chloroflexota bacterium]